MLFTEPDTSAKIKCEPKVHLQKQFGVFFEKCFKTYFLSLGEVSVENLYFAA